MAVQSRSISIGSRILSLAVAASLALGLSCAHTARADDGDGDGDGQGLQWSPSHKRFTTTQYALTLGMAGGLFASRELMHPSSQPRWSKGILLDGETRGLLGMKTASGRNTAGKLSDFLAMGLAAYPLLIDGLLVAGAVHGSADVAFQMSMISAQSLLLTALVTQLTKNLFSRQRPDVARCVTGKEAACGEQNQSFLSGHTSMAFAGAGLICAHHENLPLYGDGNAGKIACGLALAGATAVGTLRIMADRHYLTDVLAGAAVGLTAGYLLPNLINYDFGKALKLGKNARLYPMVSEGAYGIGVTGTF